MFYYHVHLPEIYPRPSRFCRMQPLSSRLWAFDSQIFTMMLPMRQRISLLKPLCTLSFRCFTFDRSRLFKGAHSRSNSVLFFFLGPRLCLLEVFYFLSLIISNVEVWSLSNDGHRYRQNISVHRTDHFFERGRDAWRSLLRYCDR